MSASAGLLAYLRDRGIRARLDGSDVVLAPRRAVTQEIAALAREHKADLAELLRAEAPLIVEEPDSGPWPLGETVPLDGEDPTAPRPCWCCGSTRRWRLKTGGPWICPKCHPPGPPEEQIEWADAVASEGFGYWSGDEGRVS